MSERVGVEQTPDIERVLAEHWKVDDLHGFYTCACGKTLGEVGVTPTLDVDPRWRAHLADRLAAAVREARAAAWDEGYTSGHSNAMRRMSDEPNAPTTPNPYRADRIAVDAPEEE